MTDTEKQEIISAIVQSATDLGTAPETSNTSDVDWLIALKGSNEPKRLSKSALVSSTTLEDTKSTLSAALARKQGKLSTDGNFTLTANNQLLLNHAAKRAVFNWLWGEVGGHYDAAIDDGWSDNAKCYTINGVWMTFNQAMKAYRLGMCRGGEGAYGAESIVTNVPRASLIVTQNNFLQHCSSMTVANIKMINLGAGAFVGCHALERIVSLNPDGSYYPEDDGLGRTAVTLDLKDRLKLTEVKIRLVNTTPITLDISGAPNVTKESLEWMLEKAQLVPCSAVTTIKLHSEVCNKYGAELMNKQTAPGASYQHRIQFSS